ncbi:hypothetical protein M0804_013470 [Polistes exclamans]|nr:hypothetical protein M0804_013470 [Polistes exclamans]
MKRSIFSALGIEASKWGLNDHLQQTTQEPSGNRTQGALLCAMLRSVGPKTNPCGTPLAYLTLFSRKQEDLMLEINNVPALRTAEKQLTRSTSQYIEAVKMIEFG